MLNELLLLWSQRPAISLAVWLVLLVTVLYLAREPAHQLLKSTGRAIYRFMRSAVVRRRCGFEAKWRLFLCVRDSFEILVEPQNLPK